MSTDTASNAKAKLRAKVMVTIEVDADKWSTEYGIEPGAATTADFASYFDEVSMADAIRDLGTLDLLGATVTAVVDPTAGA